MGNKEVKRIGLDISQADKMIKYFMSDEYIENNTNLINTLKDKNVDGEINYHFEEHIKIYSVNSYIKRLMSEVLFQGQPNMSAIGLNYKKVNKKGVGLTIANFNIGKNTYTFDFDTQYIKENTESYNPTICYSEYKLNSVNHTPAKKELPISTEMYDALIAINNFMITDGQEYIDRLNLVGRSPRDLYVFIHFDDKVIITESLMLSPTSKLDMVCFNFIEDNFDVILEKLILGESSHKIKISSGGLLKI